MKVAVQYLAQLRQAAGRADEVVELERPCSVGELVRLLAGRHGPPLANLLLGGAGGLQATLLLFVGDEQVGPGEEVLLRDGDRVTLLSPVAGG